MESKDLPKVTRLVRGRLEARTRVSTPGEWAF